MSDTIMNGSKTMLRRLAMAMTSVGLAACGAVEVPTERTWRLPLTDGVARDGAAGRGVLRVQDVRLAAHVSPERLMYAEAGARLQTHPLDVWAGPLDRMLTDFVTVALRRAGTFADVKAPLDVGAEDLWLNAVVREFHYERHGNGARAHVVADVQVRRANDAALLLARELQVDVPLADPSAAQAVSGLAAATRQVVEQIAVACRSLGNEATVDSAVAAPAGR